MKPPKKETLARFYAGKRSSRGIEELIRQDAKRKPKNESALCKCGHVKSSHHHHDMHPVTWLSGKAFCLAPNSATYCDCTGYKPRRFLKAKARKGRGK